MTPRFQVSCLGVEEGEDRKKGRDAGNWPPPRTYDETKNKAQSLDTAVIDVVVTLHVFRKLNDAKFRQIAKNMLPARRYSSDEPELCRTEKASLASVTLTGPASSRALIVEDRSSSPKGLMLTLLFSNFFRSTPRVASRTKPPKSSAAPKEEVDLIAEAAERQTPAEMPPTANAIFDLNFSIPTKHEMM